MPKPGAAPPKCFTCGEPPDNYRHRPSVWDSDDEGGARHGFVAESWTTEERKVMRGFTLTPVVAGGSSAPEPDPAPPAEVKCYRCHYDLGCDMHSPAPDGPTVKDGGVCEHGKPRSRFCSLCSYGGLHNPAPVDPRPTVKSKKGCEHGIHAGGFCALCPTVKSETHTFGNALDGNCGYWLNRSYCGKPESDPIHWEGHPDDMPAPIRDGGEWVETLHDCGNPNCKTFRRKDAPKQDETFTVDLPMGPIEKLVREQGSEPAQEPEIPAWLLAAGQAIEDADFEGETGAVDYARLILAAYAPEREKVERLVRALEQIKVQCSPHGDRGHIREISRAALSDSPGGRG